MIAYYEVRVFTPFGSPVATGITDMISLSVSRSRNTEGAFELVLPPYYTEDTFGEDYILEIWRSVDGRTFQLIDGTCFFVREIEYQLDDGGKELLYVRGHDTTGLLARHLVAWYSFGSAEAGANAPSFKTAPADTAIYEVWNENFSIGVEGTLADGYNTPPPSVTLAEGWTAATPALDALLRQMPRSPMSPEPVIITDTAPIVDGLEIAWTPAIDAMRQIADVSEQKGTKVWFDILYTPGDASSLGSFLFHVWVGNRGADLSAKVVLSPYWATMGATTWKRTYTELANWIHVGGPGSGDLRLVAGLVNQESVLRSPFYPIEAFVDAGEVFDGDALLSVGRSEMYRRRARVTIGGEIRQSEDLRFGREYTYGDIVGVFYRSVQVSAAIEAYSLELSTDNQEAISLPLEGSTNV